MAKYRIKKGDNATTVPGRFTFPRGTYVTNPLTQPVAMAKALGQFFLEKPQRLAYLAPVANAAMTNFEHMPGLDFLLNPGDYPTGTGFQHSTAWTTASLRYRLQQSGAWNTPQPFPSSQVVTPTSAPTAYPSHQQRPPVGAVVPVTYQPPKAQPSRTSQGAAPFGTDNAGRRLDVHGNIWDPATAKTDIYGGAFVQPGETRYERIGGVVKKVKYLPGNKKIILKGK